jgi:hypothetical protein
MQAYITNTQEMTLQLNPEEPQRPKARRAGKER